MAATFRRIFLKIFFFLFFCYYINKTKYVLEQMFFFILVSCSSSSVGHAIIWLCENCWVYLYKKLCPGIPFIGCGTYLVFFHLLLLSLFRRGYRRWSNIIADVDRKWRQTRVELSRWRWWRDVGRERHRRTRWHRIERRRRSKRPTFVVDIGRSPTLPFTVANDTQSHEQSQSTGAQCQHEQHWRRFFSRHHRST